MYEIVIERQDERFRAYCPALPGVEADGASKEEVIERMYEIIPQHLHDGSAQPSSAPHGG